MTITNRYTAIPIYPVLKSKYVTKVHFEKTEYFFKLIKNFLYNAKKLINSLTSVLTRRSNQYKIYCNQRMVAVLIICVLIAVI